MASMSRDNTHLWLITGFSLVGDGPLNKYKPAITPLYNGHEVLSSVSDKGKFSAENFSKNSNLDDLGIFFLIFFSGTNLKLYNIPVPNSQVGLEGHNQP